tara:strand:- start:168 stop:1445 length:1278 start_codon:yes stop_codon:yes gene_type:complete
MALTQLKTSGIADDAVTEDKIANAINTARAANTAKDLTALSAANLTSGTIPDARFPATLPATSGANLTNVPVRTNLIINGAMRVAQRATSSTASSYQTVDRWAVVQSVQNAVTQAQVDVASGTTPYSLGFRKALKVTNGDQSNGATAGSIIYIRQFLEAQDIAQSGWNYTSSSSFITLSFWIKSSVAQSFHGHLRSRDGTSQRYPFQTGALTANTWTKITKVIPGNSNVQFDTDTTANAIDRGLDITIVPYMGTTYSSSSTTFDQWQATATDNFAGTDMTTTWFTTNDATLEITGVQLEVGSTASSFAHEPIAETLRKCQRYLYILDLGSFSLVMNLQLWRLGYNTGAPHHYITWPVPMRLAPSMTKDGASYSGGGYTTNILLGSAHSTAGILYGDTAALSGQCLWHRVNNVSGTILRYIFSAEL